MTLDLEHFTPVRSLVGGLLIGLSAAALVLFDGRIAGISGIVANAIAAGARRDRGGDVGWRVAFLLGLAVAAIASRLAPGSTRIDAGLAEVAVAGLLVGVGTRLANGCTSGHGVCGLARRSPRSLVATLTFMTSAIVVVLLTRILRP